jgi:hypothetical protein
MATIDVGDVYVIAVSTYDTAGVLANATTCVITVTAPDGTITTPTVTNPSTGNYQASFTCAQAGSHKVRAVATGLVCVYTDTFYVLGTDPGFIISLAEARASLRIAAGQTVNDEDIRFLIASCTAVMEDLCGPILARTVTDTYDGGRTQIALLTTPLISITSIIESAGSGYQHTLTAQDPFTGSGFDSFGYMVDLKEGLITRTASGVAIPFIGGTRNIRVVSVAGRASIPANLIKATQRLVRFTYQQEFQGQRPAGSVPEAVGATPAGYLVPNAVKAMCAGELRVAGVA